VHATTTFDAPDGEEVTTGAHGGLGFPDRSGLPTRERTGAVHDRDQRTVGCAVVDRDGHWTHPAAADVDPPETVYLYTDSSGLLW
jgi:hypothetical protein